MAGLKWNTGNLYYSTVELGYQHTLNYLSLLFISIPVDQTSVAEIRISKVRHNNILTRLRWRSLNSSHRLILVQ